MEVQRNRWYQCKRSGSTQIVGCFDLCDAGTARQYDAMLPTQVDLVYSDPPWNPGNEKYWRNHASATESNGYESFLFGWHAAVAAAVHRGATDVFCEQSENAKHRQMVIDSRHGWDLPLLEEWTVYYGSPGSRGCVRPNRLMHFGRREISTDPSGMSGESMTIRVCAGLQMPPGFTVCDPCLGKGMTSRMAHYFQWDLIGTEINPKRLQVTVDWLIRQGYEVAECNH